MFSIAHSLPHGDGAGRLHRDTHILRPRLHPGYHLSELSYHLHRSTTPHRGTARSVQVVAYGRRRRKKRIADGVCGRPSVSDMQGWGSGGKRVGCQGTLTHFRSRRGAAVSGDRAQLELLGDLLLLSTWNRRSELAEESLATLTLPRSRWLFVNKRALHHCYRLILTRTVAALAVSSHSPSNVSGRCGGRSYSVAVRCRPGLQLTPRAVFICFQPASGDLGAAR